MRSSVGSKARYTVPIPPAPMASTTSYFPTLRGIGMGATWGRQLLLQHVQRFDERGAAAVEGLPECTNLISALGREVRRVHVPLAHLVGDRGELAHRRHHEPGEQQVEGDEEEGEQSDEQPD